VKGSGDCRTGAAKTYPRRDRVRIISSVSSFKAFRISSRHCARELSVTAASDQTASISSVFVTSLP
jgi:hypothetical protein